MRLQRGGDFGFGKRQIGHFHGANTIRLPITSFARLRSINYCLFLSLFQSPRYSLPEDTLGIPSQNLLAKIRGCHEILDLVGPSSRRILHAPFVALSRTIHGMTIALIFPSPRDFLGATAIAGAIRTRRNHLSRRTPFRAIRSIARRVKRISLFFERNELWSSILYVIEVRSCRVPVASLSGCRSVDFRLSEIFHQSLLDLH